MTHHPFRNILTAMVVATLTMAGTAGAQDHGRNDRQVERRDDRQAERRDERQVERRQDRRDDRHHFEAPRALLPEQARGNDHRDERDMERRDGRYVERRDDRRDDARFGGRGAGPDRSYYRGSRLPAYYRSNQYVVDNWRAHRLSAPPRGYHWVQTGSDYVLVAIATGIIASILLSN